MLKKICVLVVALLICAIGEAASLGSGRCGDNVNWNLDSDGTLTISGSGKMADYLIENTGTEKDGWFYVTPWYNLRPKIINIVIQNGVTSVGSHAFADLDNLKTATIAPSVTFIGSQAFSSCKNFESVNIPQNAKLGDKVFLACNKLSNISTLDAAGKVLIASNNLNEHDYTHWARTVKSYLYVDGGNLVRVENLGRNLIIEKYSPDFKLIYTNKLEGDYDVIFGGFFAGRDANFVIIGHDNEAESDSVEVMRVLKYDKNWNYIDDTKILGADTIRPFNSGSLRCVESDGKLYVRTSHQMYNKHQSNMAVVINESNMKVERLDCHVERGLLGYVSHSFNQFILIDDGKNVVMFDHGDAYPRAAALIRYTNEANYAELLNWAGSTGDNTTGGSIGGLAETVNYYVTAYNYDGVGGQPDEMANKRDLYVSFTPKNNFSVSATKTVKIPLPDKNLSVSTPIVVPLSKNGGYILWTEKTFNGRHFIASNRISGATYDNNGNVNFIGSTDGQLSDCQPIIYNGKVTWYVTNNSAPTFYTFDGNRLETHRL